MKLLAKRFSSALTIQWLSLRASICYSLIYISLCCGSMTFCSLSLSPLTILVAQQAEEKKAEKEADDEIKFPVEMKPFTLTLVNEAGEPVKGAKVIAFGIRCEESPGSWISWPTVNAGNNEFTSNDAGKVELKYPVKFGAPGLWMTTNAIDFTIQHPDFVTGRVEFDPAVGKADHTVLQGCRTRFSCVDENGKSIEKFGVLIAGEAGSAVWKHTEGELRSSGVPDGNWQTMLVAQRDDGIHLFSGVLPARYAKGKDVTIRNAKLRPGMRISGALSDNVPRPVVNGKVIAWCLPKPAGETWGDKEPSISWWDEATVNEDGTFSFASLPRGGTVQLIAVSNGWLTTGREATFIVGSLLEVGEDELKDNQVSNVVLEMAETGTVEVEVFGPDGKPLPDAYVTTWPNQKLHLGGTTIVGACYPSLQRVESQISGVEQKLSIQDQEIERYSGKTDKNGKVTLAEIPINQNHSLYVQFDNLRMKHDKDKPKDLFSDAVNFTCASTEPQKVVVQMEAITDK